MALRLFDSRMMKRHQPGSITHPWLETPEPSHINHIRL